MLVHQLLTFDWNLKSVRTLCDTTQTRMFCQTAGWRWNSILELSTPVKHTQGVHTPVHTCGSACFIRTERIISSALTKLCFLCWTLLFTQWKCVCVKGAGEFREKEGLCSAPSFVNTLGQQPWSAQLEGAFCVGLFKPLSPGTAFIPIPLAACADT